MRRLSRMAPIFAAVLMLVSCAGGGDMNPASPTPAPTPSATTTAVTVTSPAVTGSTFQLTAVARLSDGSTRDVTAIAAWATSNPLIANVSATGLVTVVGSGNVELRAMYQNVVGTLAI